VGRLQAAGIARRTPSSVAGPPSSSGPWAARRSRLRSRGSSCDAGSTPRGDCLLGWGERPGRGPLQRSLKPRQPDPEVASDGSHVHCLSVVGRLGAQLSPAGVSRREPQHPTRPCDRARETVLGRSRPVDHGHARNHTPASVSLTTPETTALDELQSFAQAPNSRLLSTRNPSVSVVNGPDARNRGQRHGAHAGDAHQTAGDGAACLALRLPCRADPIGARGASCFGRNPSYDVPNNRTWRSLLRAHSWAWRSLRCYCSSVECEASREPRRTLAPRGCCTKGSKKLRNLSGGRRIAIRSSGEGLVPFVWGPSATPAWVVPSQIEPRIPGWFVQQPPSEAEAWSAPAACLLLPRCDSDGA
jgi:hypothetical protein